MKTYRTLIDLETPQHVRVVNFEVDENGVSSVFDIVEHGVEPGDPIEMPLLLESASVEPINWEWRGEYVGNIDWAAQQYQNNYRKLQLISELKELLEAEEELAAQLADCRAHIKRMRHEVL